jgi:hypothetical protein
MTNSEKPFLFTNQPILDKKVSFDIEKYWLFRISRGHHHIWWCPHRNYYG